MKNLLRSAREARDALAPIVHGDVDDERACRLFAAHTWSCLVEPGDGIAGRLVGALGYERALAEVIGEGSGAGARDAARVGANEWTDARARWRHRLDPDRVWAALDLASRSGVSLVTAEDADWPAALADLGDHAPLVLWVRGDMRALTRGSVSVAVVGARAATNYGEHVAMELAAGLAGRGVSIVSGAAYGIDGAAHRAALAAGGTTIALLAGGADRAYPAGHAELLQRISGSGAVVSEVPCGSDPTKWRFLQRNRVIAALADATVVVEAGWRSGSLNTAGHAAALSRPLGAVPGPITSAASAGCHRLLREFDARCVTNTEEVLELVGGLSPTLFDMPVGADGDRIDDSTRVTDAMSFRAWRGADDIARRSGIAPSDASAILGLLALEGAVERGENGWRRVHAGAPVG
jgi:DNA processing protein